VTSRDGRLWEFARLTINIGNALLIVVVLLPCTTLNNGDNVLHVSEAYHLEASREQCWGFSPNQSEARKCFCPNMETAD